MGLGEKDRHKEERRRGESFGEEGEAQF